MYISEGLYVIVHMHQYCWKLLFSVTTVFMDLHGKITQILSLKNYIAIQLAHNIMLLHYLILVSILFYSTCAGNVPHPR